MANENTPLEHLSRILAGLGDPPDQVAEALRTTDCRGFRNGSLPSPVIRYAYRSFDSGSLGLVYSREAVLLRFGRPTGRMQLPPAVAQFLALFDDGTYPNLDSGMEARRR